MESDTSEFREGGYIHQNSLVYTQRENQSQEGRRYKPSVRPNHRRGGGITQRENQSQDGRQYIPSTRTNHRRGGGSYSA
eukprot:745688-Prorocentrum_minimum.AAC.2